MKILKALSVLMLTAFVMGMTHSAHAKRIILDLHIIETNGTSTPTDIDDLGGTDLYTKNILSPTTTEHTWHREADAGAVFSTPHPTVGQSYITIPDSLIQEIPGGEFWITVNGISANICQFTLKIDQNWLQGVPDDTPYGQSVERAKANCRSNGTVVDATQTDPDVPHDPATPNMFNGQSHNSATKELAVVYAIQDLLDDMGIAPSSLCEDVDLQCPSPKDCVPNSLSAGPVGEQASNSNTLLTFTTTIEEDGEFGVMILGMVNSSSGGHANVQFSAKSCGCYNNIVEL